jgi:hypothetical protein
LTQKNVIVCDQCGTEVAEDEAISRPLHTGRRGRPRHVDLCPACATQATVGETASAAVSPSSDDQLASEAELPQLTATAEPLPVPPEQVLTPPPTVASPTAAATIRNHAAFIWSVADLLRGDYKQSEYGKVILPLVVLRRLDCVLEPTKAAENGEPVLCAVSGEQFYNVSKLDLPKVLDDPANIEANLHTYIQGSHGVRGRCSTV